MIFLLKHTSNLDKLTLFLRWQKKVRWNACQAYNPNYKIDTSQTSLILIKFIVNNINIYFAN